MHGGENKDGRGSRYSVSKRRSSRYSMHRLSHMANLENFSKSSLPHWANGLLTPMVEAASEESNESVGRVPVHALRVPFNKFAGFYDSVEMSPLFLILQVAPLACIAISSRHSLPNASWPNAFLFLVSATRVGLSRIDRCSSAD